MKRHPLDEWVEVTEFGHLEPTYLLARDGREIAIAQAKAAYIEGRITVEELEAEVMEALHPGSPASNPSEVNPQ